MTFNVIVFIASLQNKIGLIFGIFFLLPEVHCSGMVWPLGGVLTTATKLHLGHGIWECSAFWRDSNKSPYPCEKSGCRCTYFSICLWDRLVGLFVVLTPV